MERFSVLWLFCYSLLVTSHQEPLPQHSVTVYPQLFESRDNSSEKVLVVAAGYSLNLNKASVLAGSVLLRDLTDTGVIETYIAGKEHERGLYQDSDKLASLLLKPQGEGQYHIVGLLNSTHQIQPVEAVERSSEGLIAHRILPIKFNAGINAAIKAAHDSYQEQVANVKVAALSMRLPENFTIELAFCSDYYHTVAFGNDTKARVQYVLTLLLAVSLRLQQLSPPGFISIVYIQGSFTKKESYVSKLNETVLLGTETLRSLSKYASKKTTMRRADVVFLATGRAVAQKDGQTVRFGTEGLAFMGSACTNNKVGLAVDAPKSFSAVQSMTHEIAHLLNSNHDGDGSSRTCNLSDGYLMHRHLGGKWNYIFSNCSILAVRHFLTTMSSLCLKVQERHHNVFLPGSFLNPQNATLKGQDYCKKFFPDYKEVSYAGAENPTNNCHFRCKIFSRIFGTYYANLYAPTGTPCNATLHESTMRCNYGLCE
ncbi:venom metalloproteinase antarease-like TtrivMP_A isoform X2 [Rhipicephalus sanguineus]|uniref:venom metalloproteinase antarease-like TtrivMP_A isoform X2 n=1 Tax=Rhipicephalus sanguineus TaxID=34632 RepID=UPI0018958F3D|nr:venom metalloproteinase antarease-like TtrivMP_A isoform X2 [Rhipicephalus sanguineus]